MIEFFIEKVRKEKGLSQDQLSEISGVSSTHIGAIERGEREPTITILCKLAEALRCDINELFDYKR